MRIQAPLVVSVLLSACMASALAAAESKPASAGALSAAQIIDRHVAARGGLAAWRAVQTLSVSGKLDAGTSDSLTRSITMAQQGAGASARRAQRAAAESVRKAAAEPVLLPFRLEMKRPRKSRFEVDFAGATAVQVYDGRNGWKLRPYLNRDDVEPFTEEEAKAEAAKADLDGPLVDYVAKGTQVALEGTEPVDGRNAYKLKLTMKNGDVRHVWIDVQSFLDVKIEGAPRRFNGQMRNVWISQRDFRSVTGLMLPFVYETTIESGRRPHKMVIESATMNTPLDDARFSKPQELVAASKPAAATAAPVTPPKK